VAEWSRSALLIGAAPAPFAGGVTKAERGSRKGINGMNG